MRTTKISENWTNTVASFMKNSFEYLYPIHLFLLISAKMAFFNIFRVYTIFIQSSNCLRTCFHLLTVNWHCNVFPNISIFDDINVFVTKTSLIMKLTSFIILWLYYGIPWSAFCQSCQHCLPYLQRTKLISYVIRMSYKDWFQKPKK